MTAMRLALRREEKIWGRHDIPSIFGPAANYGEPIGEIWFEDPRGTKSELLIKYLFTAESLSIQVHPDDDAARAAGLPRGKDEAWLVLDAEPNARIVLGLKNEVSRADLKLAALNGSLERLVDYRAAKAGDIHYFPAGTIHALGAGLTVIEIQQNLDRTYRLYDYGRARDLHLDEAVAAAKTARHVEVCRPYEVEPGRQILAHGHAFVVERWTAPAAGHLDGERPVWVIPIGGAGEIDGQKLEPGTAWLAEGRSKLSLSKGCDVLLAYSGGVVVPTLLNQDRRAVASSSAVTG